MAWAPRKTKCRGPQVAADRRQDRFLDPRQRGLSKPPKLAVGDGVLGFWAAVLEVYPTAGEQLCWSHPRPDNPINNAFSTIRLRQRRTKKCGTSREILSRRSPAERRRIQDLRTHFLAIARRAIMNRLPAPSNASEPGSGMAVTRNAPVPVKKLL